MIERPQNFSLRFFRRYNVIIWSTLLVLCAILAVLLFLQVEDSIRAELATLTDRVRERGDALNDRLRTTGDNVDALHIAAERFYALTPEDAPPTPLFQALIGQADNGFFSLDRIPPPYKPEFVANLSGDGPIDRSRAREIEMALSLNPQFQIAYDNLRNRGWIYYQSYRHFISLYPWVPSARFGYAQELSHQDQFDQAMPPRNPDWGRIWTEVYRDEGGKGLMITAQWPILEKGEFRGIVGVDITIDEMKEPLQNFNVAGAAIFVVNKSGQIVAHRSVSADDTTIATLAQILPADIADWTMRDIERLQGPTFTLSRGYYALARQLPEGPFHLVFLVSRAAVVKAAVFDVLPEFTGVVLGLIVMLAIANFATRREFIEPARELVSYIDAQARSETVAVPPVPQGWRPWFDTIKGVFAEHGQLISIRQELDVARRMQQSILPTRFPRRQDLEIHGRMEPAKEVGGDFYDYFWLDETRIGVVVADVSGKGVPAALFMAVARTLLRAIAPLSASPGECLRTANDLLSEDNEQVMFVTVFYGVLELDRGRMLYANGGHNLPLLIAPDGSVAPLAAADGMALGVVADADFDTSAVDLAAGATLILFTDGVTEAQDPAGDLFGDARLSDTARGLQAGPVAGVTDSVFDAVHAFAGSAPQSDDITCLALRYYGPRQEA